MNNIYIVHGCDTCDGLYGRIVGVFKTLEDAKKAFDDEIKRDIVSMGKYKSEEEIETDTEEYDRYRESNTIESTLEGDRYDSYEDNRCELYSDGRSINYYISII